MNHPSDGLQQETHPTLVSVLMHDGGRYRGFIHLPAKFRLQDLLNDNRAFIPLEQASSSESVTIVSKRYIVSIEELREGLSELALNVISLA